MELSQISEDSNSNKIAVAFKCNPALKSTLCEQADRLGITLSSHLESIVASYKNKDDEIKQLLSIINSLKERIVFYENPFLTEIYERHKGQAVSYLDRQGNRVDLTINGITDVYTVIISSFTID